MLIIGINTRIEFLSTATMSFIYPTESAELAGKTLVVVRYSIKPRNAGSAVDVFES